MSTFEFAIIDDTVFEEHRAAGRHPECPERLIAARRGLFAGLGDRNHIVIPTRTATREEIARVHSVSHIERLERLPTDRFSMLDADTYVSPGSRHAAWHAAGGAVELAHALMTGRAKRGFALLRPPGHHAEPDRAMGFCLLNNVAIAAAAALGAGAERIAVVDWDVHHGNGTQLIFERDPRVFFMSLHQWPLYPGTGAPNEIGLDAGRGTTANFALPPGAGPNEYAEAFRMGVVPWLDGFAPNLILVSAGYDAHQSDPLGAMHLDAESFGAMASALVEVSERHAQGRIGFFLEGGYDLKALEESVEATVRAALGERHPLSSHRASDAARSAIEATRNALGQGT